MKVCTNCGTGWVAVPVSAMRRNCAEGDEGPAGRSGLQEKYAELAERSLN